MNRRPASSDTFLAIAHPSRRRLIELLGRGEKSVGALAEGFLSSGPALSQHLKVLRDSGLVAQRREGRRRVYFLTPGPLAEVSRWVSENRSVWEVRLAALGDYLDETKEDS